jgi:hypothetical protein
MTTGRGCSVSEKLVEKPLEKAKKPVEKLVSGRLLRSLL